MKCVTDYFGYDKALHENIKPVTWQYRVKPFENLNKLRQFVQL